MTKPPLGMRASRNCHQVHPKKVSKNCQEACFSCLKRQKVFEVWGQSQLAESYSLASPDFLQPFSRWFLGGGFKDFECFFTTSNWRNKSKKMKCASSFLFTSSAERNHQTSLFAHILRGFGCSMCFFFPVSEAMFCWSFTISMPLWISRYVCSWPSSRERNKDL